MYIISCCFLLLFLAVVDFVSLSLCSWELRIENCELRIENCESRIGIGGPLWHLQGTLLRAVASSLNGPQLQLDFEIQITMPAGNLCNTVVASSAWTHQLLQVCIRMCVCAHVCISVYLYICILNYWTHLKWYFMLDFTKLFLINTQKTNASVCCYCCCCCCRYLFVLCCAWLLGSERVPRAWSNERQL